MPKKLNSIATILHIKNTSAPQARLKDEYVRSPRYSIHPIPPGVIGMKPANKVIGIKKTEFHIVVAFDKAKPMMKMPAVLAR